MRHNRLEWRLQTRLFGFMLLTSILYLFVSPKLTMVSDEPHALRHAVFPTEPRAHAFPTESSILFLSPIRETHSRRHARFVRNLCATSQVDGKPSRIAFLVDMVSYEIVAESSVTLRACGFFKVDIFKEAPKEKSDELDIPGVVFDRHDYYLQRDRRKRIAAARNYLLSQALGRDEWV